MRPLGPASPYFIEKSIGFRCENPFFIRAGGCEPLSKFPLGVDVIG